MIGNNISNYIEIETNDDNWENTRIASYSSMNTTNSYSNISKKEIENTKPKLEETPRMYHSGVRFKISYGKMIELVFTTLKDLNMIWKRLNSDFVYKCHSGVSISDNEKYEDRAAYEEFLQKEMIKFFIQFSTVDPQKYKTSEITSDEEVKKEYLWSFIWIKGNSGKFLEFVSKFKQTIKDKLEN